MIGKLSLSEAALQFGHPLMNPDCVFDAVSTDSRSISNGELFVALKGENFDGHRFLQQVSTIAGGVVVEQPVKTLMLPQWVVPDTTLALGQLAVLNRQRFEGTLVAITGSSGKTTVKEMLAAIFSCCGSVLATKGNLNNHIGVPKTLFSLCDEHQFAVIEMGASGPGEIDYLSRMAAPQVVLVNNVMAAHIDGFGSLSGVAAAKGEIYRHVQAEGVAVVNADEPWAADWEAMAAAPVVRFCLDGTDAIRLQADFYARDISANALGCCAFTLCTPKGDARIQLPLSGEHNVRNALAAATCALSSGIGLSHVVSGLEGLSNVPGRMSRHRLANGALVIDDSYNANPGAMKAAVDTLMSLPGKHVLVLGDMGELGEDEAALHSSVGEYAARQGVDQLWCIGDLMVNAAREFGNNAKHFDDKQVLVEQLLAALQAADSAEWVVLVKGSRFMGMDAVVTAVLGEESL